LRTTKNVTQMLDRKGKQTSARLFIRQGDSVK
jgi:hypothetical protein